MSRNIDIKAKYSLRFPKKVKKIICPETSKGD